MTIPEYQLPHSQEEAQRLYLKRLKLERYHQELASYYRANSRDRKTIANLWYYIDALELDLRSEGVVL